MLRDQYCNPQMVIAGIPKRELLEFQNGRCRNLPVSGSAVTKLTHNWRPAEPQTGNSSGSLPSLQLHVNT